MSEYRLLTGVFWGCCISLPIWFVLLFAGWLIHGHWAAIVGWCR
jgi:hypothetical protein